MIGVQILKENFLKPIENDAAQETQQNSVNLENQ
tara:strand:- start:4522 stop:4623 length:102 start_codon:yes stop_codon:yes gene_type:complete